MAMFPLLLLLLLSSVQEVTASALLGRQWPSSDGGTAMEFNKPGGSSIFTTYSVIYRDGDASRRRTAESGYDIRVDVVNSAWAFCRSNDPSLCDMGGACFDKFSCSTGCGSGNPALKTWTCAGSKARYCSTDLLTLSRDSPRAVTYLACGDRPDRTQEYKVFTTNAKPSASSSSAPKPLPTPPQTSQIATASTSPSQAAAQTAASTESANNDDNNDNSDTNDTNNSSNAGNTSNTNDTDDTNDTNNTDNTNNTDSNTNTSNSTNTAMTVGAAVGCVALICIFVVVVFLIRRTRATSAATAATTPTTMGEATTDGAAVASAQGLYKSPLGELDGERGVYEIGQGCPVTPPVELPGTRWESTEVPTKSLC